MVYISNAQVLDSWSQFPWILSLITDFFWGIAEFVVLFFKTLSYGNSCDSRYDAFCHTPSPPNRPGQ
uniref:Selenoprotein K n=1 Tax=Colobus angolensis palliatus TaxID=336983 RepID=A0A2K5J765_COLAP